MGKPKPNSTVCGRDICNKRFVMSNRVRIQFRIGGKDLDLCPSCEKSEIERLRGWLFEKGKELRKMSKKNPKALLFFTEELDYEGDLEKTAEAIGDSLVEDRLAAAQPKPKLEL